MANKLSSEEINALLGFVSGEKPKKTTENKPFSLNNCQSNISTKLNNPKHPVIAVSTLSVDKLSKKNLNSILSSKPSKTFEYSPMLSFHIQEKHLKENSIDIKEALDHISNAITSLVSNPEIKPSDDIVVISFDVWNRANNEISITVLATIPINIAEAIQKIELEREIDLF